MPRSAASTRDGGSAEPHGSRPARIESRIEVSICRCSGTRAPRSSSTRTPELVLILATNPDLTIRTGCCQARPAAIGLVKEHTVRRIINSTYISLDGVIQNPQDWPDNGIEPDGTSVKMQTDLLFACDAVLMGGRTYPGFAAAWMARSGDPYSDRINEMTKYVVSGT